MAIFKEGAKKVTGIYANVDGSMKKIVSAWVNKDGVPTKVFGVGGGGGLPFAARFIALGNSSTKPYYSLDGETWVEMTGIYYTYWNDVVYGNGRLVAVNQNGYSMWSTDGETWNYKKVGYNFYAVVYANGKFLGLGSNSAGGFFYSSEDGETWTYLGKVSRATVLTYGNGKFVAAGTGTIYYSEDGVTWTAATNKPSGYILDVRYLNGKFIAYGYSGYNFAWSEDGVTWEIYTIDSSLRFYDVAYGNGKYVALASKNEAAQSYVYTSVDGVTWELSATMSHSSIHDLVFGNGLFIASYSSATYKSVDGITWEKITDLGTGSYISMTYTEEIE